MTSAAATPLPPARPTIRLRSNADLLAVVPPLLGFHPRRSIVAIALHPPRRQVGFAMRMDIDQGSAERLAHEVAVRLASAGAPEVLVVLYDPEHAAETETEPEVTEPGRQLIVALQAALAERRIELNDAVWVRNERYRSYLCDDPGCCPPDGKPVLQPSDPGGPAAVGAATALAGMGALADRETLERSVRQPQLFERAAMEQALDRACVQLEEQVIVGPLGLGSAAEQCFDGNLWAYSDETLRLLEQAASRWARAGADLSTDEAARLITGLQHLGTRDRVIALGALEGRAAAESIDRLIQFLTELTRRSVPPYGAQVAATLGMLAYQQGSGALASVACERALRDDPACSCAQLLGQLISRQVHPKEVRRSARRAGRELTRQRREQSSQRSA